MKNGKGCIDCRCYRYETVDYMVYNLLWQIVGAEKKDILCLTCLSKRLGRKLKRADFPPDININKKIIALLDCVEK